MAQPNTLTLEIVTPEHALVTAQVEEVQLPGAAGYFGVLPGHTPLLAALHVGELWYRIGPERHYLSIAFGFVEVQPDRVTVLAQIAERAQDIDVARAESARRRAEERVAQGRSGEVDFERARVALAKALVRLQVASRARTRV